MGELILGIIVGIVVGVTITCGFWLINRWYWKEMYKSEQRYSDQVVNLFEQNHPFKVTRINKSGNE